MKKIVIIGGANGTATVIKALKGSNVHLTVIQTPADDGGSGGAVRKVFNMMAPGDTRRALIALSNLKDKTVLAAFTHRYAKGSLTGHVVGNLVLAALTQETGSFERAIEKVKKLLQVTGDIIPASLTPATLVAKLENGKIITGETNIDKPRHNPKLKIKKVWFASPVTLNPKASSALMQADVIIIGPGDLYTSIIPNFLVSGMRQVIKKSKAKKIYIVNSVNKVGETTNFTPEDYVREIKNYAGTNAVDAVLMPTNIRSKKRGLYTPAQLRRALLKFLS